MMVTVGMMSVVTLALVVVEMSGSQCGEGSSAAAESSSPC